MYMNKSIEELEERVAMAEGTADLAMKHRDAAEARAGSLAAENARLREALTGACEQILDSYRTWVADDNEAHPRPGQIPRYDAALAALASPTEPEGG